MNTSSTPRLRLLAVAALVAVTAIWGSTFVIIKGAITTVDPSDFLFVRFLLASLILVPIVWRSLRRLDRRSILIGLGIGGVYGAAQLLQTWGLANTSAAVSGFLTGAYVVFTPLVAAAVVRARVSGRTILATVTAMVGIGVLSLTGLAVGAGEALTLFSAVVYALHIVLVGRYAQHIPALTFAALQMVGVTVVLMVFAIPGGVHIPAEPGAWGAILYTAVLASIGVLFLQSWAQQHLSAATTAIIMALEPIFATLFAIGFGGEPVTARLLIGGTLIIVAILLATVGVPGEAELLSEQPDADAGPADVPDPGSGTAAAPPGNPSAPRREERPAQSRP